MASLNLKSKIMHDNFSKQADLYAKYRPRYPKAMYDFIFQHLQGKQTAWDCATGSGQVAGYLAPHFKRVVATDISDEQMKHASGKANIKYVNAPAEDSGLPSNTFDLITVAQAIHWFDFDCFYSEVKRTAKEGALLAVIGYGMVQVNEDIDLLIKNFYDFTFNKYFKDNRQYLDRHYKTIPFPFEEIECPEFSISYQWSLEKLEGYFKSWSAVQKIKEDEGYNPVNDFMKKLKEDWNQGEVKEVTFPVFMRLGQIMVN
jgi:ubiquinone/menaquinone biosynthesis C-methylase UbiE